MPQCWARDAHTSGRLSTCKVFSDDSGAHTFLSFLFLVGNPPCANDALATLSRHILGKNLTCTNSSESTNLLLHGQKGSFSWQVPERDVRHSSTGLPKLDLLTTKIHDDKLIAVAIVLNWLHWKPISLNKFWWCQHTHMIWLRHANVPDPPDHQAMAWQFHLTQTQLVACDIQQSAGYLEHSYLIHSRVIGLNSWWLLLRLVGQSWHFSLLLVTDQSIWSFTHSSFLHLAIHKATYHHDSRIDPGSSTHSFLGLTWLSSLDTSINWCSWLSNHLQGEKACYSLERACCSLEKACCSLKKACYNLEKALFMWSSTWHFWRRGCWSSASCSSEPAAVDLASPEYRLEDYAAKGSREYGALGIRRNFGDIFFQRLHGFRQVVQHVQLHVANRVN